MGFKNIKEINLHDLKFGILIPHGTVRSVTINGSEPIHDYWYEPDAEVIIKFSGTK